jgi:HTH-type transcriptional regulator / antitoxin HigA
MEDYDRALKEVELYFENPPEPGTEAQDRFEVLVALIAEFERIHFPMPS